MGGPAEATKSKLATPQNLFPSIPSCPPENVVSPTNAKFPELVQGTNNLPENEPTNLGFKETYFPVDSAKPIL